MSIRLNMDEEMRRLGYRPATEDEIKRYRKFLPKEPGLFTLLWRWLTWRFKWPNMKL